MTYRIAVVVGSLREGSINRKVARALCAMAPATLDCGFVEFGDLPLYNQDRDGDPPPEWVRFRDEIAPPTACCSSRRSIIARSQAH